MGISFPRLSVMVRAIHIKLYELYRQEETYYIVAKDLNYEVKVPGSNLDGPLQLHNLTNCFTTIIFSCVILKVRIAIVQTSEDYYET